jgi:hypothetical protein
VETAADLTRRHDEALFRRAFPRAAQELAETERELASFGPAVSRLEAAGEDLSPLDEFETSGIAGTVVTMDFSWGIARWLARRHGPSGSVSLSWEGEPPEARLAATLPRFLPLLDERALADSGTDFRPWLEAALPRGTKTVDGGLAWLVDRFDELPLSDRGRAELWDSLGFLVRWELREAPVSRTLARLPNGEPFVSADPLVPRAAVSLAREMDESRVRVVRLPRSEGEAFLDAARAAIAVRYREIHAFTWGNPADVVRADLGRGLSILCCGILPALRLPLRSGYGALLVRNGVPIGYVDAYAMGDRIDLAFNVFYTFRSGESAWAYARVAAFFRKYLGVSTICVDPYQFGKGNEEAIKSGAFWFYRKLGFRSLDPGLERLARREEARVAADPSYRTPPSVLRRLAGETIAFDGPGARPGRWELLSAQALGLAVQRRLAASGRTPSRFAAGALKRVSRALGLDAAALSPAERDALARLAPALDLLPSLGRWPGVDRQALARFVKAKGARSESAAPGILAKNERAAAELLRAAAPVSSVE